MESVVVLPLFFVVSQGPGDTTQGMSWKVIFRLGAVPQAPAHVS